MASYLHRFDETPTAERWPLVRRWMLGEPLTFFDELRRNRPVLATPEVTLAVRFSDCRDILLQHDIFSVALYRSKQGDYWMPQDDTAVHWREKSIMRAILDRETFRRFGLILCSKQGRCADSCSLWRHGHSIGPDTRRATGPRPRLVRVCRQRSGGIATVVLLEPDGRVLESAFRRDRRARPAENRRGAGSRNDLPLSLVRPCERNRSQHGTKPRGGK
jgi:hypothetical protein